MVRVEKVLLALIVCLAVATPASAGLGQRLVRGVTYTLTPNLGSFQNGPNFNRNVLTQRFDYDPITQGRSYEVFRLFGDDTYGNPETFNLGLLNVTLREPDGSGLLGAGFYSRVGYNARIVPEVYWDTRTTGRNVAGFTANSAVAAPVQYRIQTFLGLQEITLNGQLQLNSAGSVNALGFYNVQVSASNSGTAQTSGLGENNTERIDFDFGPVNLSGNLYIDLTLAAVEAIGEQLGVAPENLPFVAARERTVDEVQRAIDAGQSVSARQFNAYLANLVAQTPDAAAPTYSSQDQPTVTSATAGGVAFTVPEPGTLLLLAAGVAIALRRPRRAA